MNVHKWKYIVSTFNKEFTWKKLKLHKIWDSETEYLGDSERHRYHTSVLIVTVTLGRGLIPVITNTFHKEL